MAGDDTINDNYRQEICSTITITIIIVIIVIVSFIVKKAEVVGTSTR